MTEYCFWCGGLGERRAIGGYTKCLHCTGTGYGESMQTYWKRMGITPETHSVDDAETQRGTIGRDELLAACKAILAGWQSDGWSGMTRCLDQVRSAVAIAEGVPLETRKMNGGPWPPPDTETNADDETVPVDMANYANRVLDMPWLHVGDVPACCICHQPVLTDDTVDGKPMCGGCAVQVATAIVTQGR